MSYKVCNFDFHCMASTADTCCDFDLVEPSGIPEVFEWKRSPRQKKEWRRFPHTKWKRWSHMHGSNRPNKRLMCKTLPVEPRVSSGKAGMPLAALRRIGKPILLGSLPHNRRRKVNKIRNQTMKAFGWILESGVPQLSSEMPCYQHISSL